MSEMVKVCKGQPQGTKGPCDLTLTNERKAFAVSSTSCNKNERLIIRIQVFLYSLKKLFLSFLSLNKILLHLNIYH
jgi:hypothetical protein